MSRISERPIEEGQSPLMVRSLGGHQGLADLIAGNPSEWNDKLLEHGALLFRGFAVHDVNGFDLFIRALSSSRSDYVYGSTPRQAIGDRIFTASEFPPAHEIPLHNENAYQRVWPLKVSFCCLQAAASGGQTPIADMRRVQAGIGERLIDLFERRGVMYVRHYHPSVDVPWQQAFRTDDPQELADFCLSQGIEHDWLDGNLLRTIQVCQGAAYHPLTRERVFFNQAHLFHASSMGPEMLSAMCQLFGPERLPRQALFGDGSEIPVDHAQRIRTAFRDAGFAFGWNTGDVLLLDNMRFAHGRRSFKGSRRLIAALTDPHCPWKDRKRMNGRLPRACTR
jgi:hypothetical protein